MKSFKPMLAATLCESDLDNLTFPLIIQPKLDGIRCCLLNGKAVSRKLKPIPNKYVRHILENFISIYPSLIDGEIILRGNKTFNEIQSAIMSEDGEPDFAYIIFDWVEDWNSDYNTRWNKKRLVLRPYIDYLNSTLIYNKEELLEWEKSILDDQYEGIILRAEKSLYKFGRSTIREQALMKFKRFQDSEAIILSSNPLLINTNANQLDNLGYTEHSSHQDGLEATEQLGSWTVRDCNKESPFYNVIFNIGSGLTELQRVRFWQLKEQQKERIIKYKYQLHGSKNKPRSPIWLGFRED